MPWSIAQLRFARYSMNMWFLGTAARPEHVRTGAVWRVDGLRDQVAAEGLTDGLGLGMDVELFVDAADVIADGIDAYAELAGGALVAVALHEQLEEAHFLRRELLVQFLRRAGLLEQGDDFARDLGRHGGAAVMCLANGFQQFCRRRLLQQIPAGAVADRFKDLVLLGVDREHDDL